MHQGEERAGEIQYTYIGYKEYAENGNNNDLSVDDKEPPSHLVVRRQHNGDESDYPIDR